MRTLVWLALCAAGLVARPALAANEIGQKLFADHCVVCHQEDARGAAGVAPPLADALSRPISPAPMASAICGLGTFNGVRDADAAKPISPQDVTAAGAANPAPTATRALRQSVKSHP